MLMQVALSAGYLLKESQALHFHIQERQAFSAIF